MLEVFPTAESSFQTGIIGHHELPGGAVAYRPQAHNECFGPRQKKGTAQSVDTFAMFHFPQARFAGRERDDLSSPEIQAGDLECCQYAVVPGAFAQIGPGQREPGTPQRVMQKLRASYIVQEKSMCGDVKNGR